MNYKYLIAFSKITKIEILNYYLLNKLSKKIIKIYLALDKLIINEIL